jgi:hypothetical protein
VLAFCLLGLLLTMLPLLPSLKIKGRGHIDLGF